MSELRRIPGVGVQTEKDLNALGIRTVNDLVGKDPEELYRRECERRGCAVDRCVLYVYRCAVYYATCPVHDPELLKWWNHKDK